MPRQGRTPVTAPDKGAFPLDHFHECQSFSKLYNDCLMKHQLMPKRCQKFQMDYLECRMKNNLMEQESFDKLGFNETTSWNTEEEMKRDLFTKLVEIHKMADRNIYRMQGYDHVDNNIYNV
ncbi:unnamed protein product [Moneuplotes crassus]|nr:unnamed protein product [Moneuplotes crassus]